MKNKFLQISMFLLSCCLLLSFVACNNAGSGEATTDAKENDTQTEANETDAATEKGNEIEEETDLNLGDDVEYAADFTVSGVFGDNMIIQRGEYIRVWGWADESENGKKVTASFMNYKADALIEDGAWEVVIHAKLEANKTLGNSLKVFTDSKTVAFNDVLVGDVYMVIGQSNVQYGISQYLNSEPDLKWTTDKLDPNSVIRMNYNSNTDNEGYPTRGTADVCIDVVTKNGWVIPDEDNVMRLSAIGYFIAYQIAEKTNNEIPIGISQFSASGRPLSVFMPNELADELKSDHFDESQGVYIGNVHSSVVTRYMYNHYILPYERMPIAGLVWYQGEAESSLELSTVFAERFSILMNYMRGTHNLVNKEFPVFIVELPSVYKVEGSSEYLDTGRIRAAQGLIPTVLSNSYLAVAADIWNDKENSNNIHPYKKYEQAERVTALIDAVVYGGQTVDKASGPIIESYEISADNKTIVLKFKNCGEGLTTSDGGTNVTGMFQVSRKNKMEKRYPVVATITGPDTVTVTCEKEFSGVAYHAIAEMFYGEDVNLCDSDGTPAAAFWIYEK